MVAGSRAARDAVHSCAWPGPIQSPGARRRGSEPEYAARQRGSAVPPAGVAARAQSSLLAVAPASGCQCSWHEKFQSKVSRRERHCAATHRGMPTATGAAPLVLALVGLLAAPSCVAKDPSAKPSNVTFRQMSGTTFATATNKSIYRNAISVNRLVRHWASLASTSTHQCVHPTSFRSVGIAVLRPMQTKLHTSDSDQWVHGIGYFAGNRLEHA